MDRTQATRKLLLWAAAYASLLVLANLLLSPLSAVLASSALAATAIWGVARIQRRLSVRDTPEEFAEHATTSWLWAAVAAVLAALGAMIVIRNVAELVASSLELTQSTFLLLLISFVYPALLAVGFVVTRMSPAHAPAPGAVSGIVYSMMPTIVAYLGERTGASSVLTTVSGQGADLESRLGFLLGGVSTGYLIVVGSYLALLVPLRTELRVVGREKKARLRKGSDPKFGLLLAVLGTGLAAATLYLQWRSLSMDVPQVSASVRKLNIYCDKGGINEPYEVGIGLEVEFQNSGRLGTTLTDFEMILALEDDGVTLGSGSYRLTDMTSGDEPTASASEVLRLEHSSIALAHMVFSLFQDRMPQSFQRVCHSIEAARGQPVRENGADPGWTWLALRWADVQGRRHETNVYIGMLRGVAELLFPPQAGQ